MSNELYKPTLPVEPGWYRCERVESDDVDCCLLTHWGLWAVPGCGEPLRPQIMSEKYLFGPRVEMPIAEPVEVFSVMYSGEFDLAYASLDECRLEIEIGSSGLESIYRGVFTPTEIVTQ